MEENKVNLDTMIGVGKKKQIAGREYMILPVNICDMHYIMGENNKDENFSTSSLDGKTRFSRNTCVLCENEEHRKSFLPKT